MDDCWWLAVLCQVYNSIHSPGRERRVPGWRVSGGNWPPLRLPNQVTPLAHPRPLSAFSFYYPAWSHLLPLSPSVRVLPSWPTHLVISKLPVTIGNHGLRTGSRRGGQYGLLRLLSRHNRDFCNSDQIKWWARLSAADEMVTVCTNAVIHESPRFHGGWPT